jgi:HTH-type transcriptional regulator / antitoxin MqsA
MSISKTVCPVCDEGRLTEEVYVGEIHHNGAKLMVSGLERCRCDTCAADPVLAEQIKRNQLRIADARRTVDGLLCAQEIRAAREAMQLSQAQAAEIFGGGANAFSKYERGEVAQSVAMDRLIRLTRDFPEAVQLLASYAGVSICTTRGSTGYVAAHTITATVARTAGKARTRVLVNSPGIYAEAA